MYFYLFHPISTYSQQDSLKAYMEIASKNNPTVHQRYYEYEAALQKVPQVGSLPDPDLSLGVFLKPMEIVNGKQVADIRLMQMFPWFGELKSAKDEMTLMAKTKFESFRDAGLQLSYDVQRTWYDLHKIRQNIRISEKNIELLRSIERLAVVRFQFPPAGNNASTPGRASIAGSNQANTSGSSVMQSRGGNQGNNPGSASSSMPGNPMGSPSGGSALTDVYRIQIETGELQNNIELLKSQWKTIASQFNSYLNRPPDALVTIPDTLIADDFQPSLLSLSDSFPGNNPMMEMIQFEQQSLEARKKMVTKMGFPMIGFGVNYSLINKSDMSASSMNGKDMIMPMVTATLPIYRKKYKAMQTETELLRKADMQNYQATANALHTEYYQAMQLYQDAHRRIKLYADQYQLAAKSLDIMIKNFSSSSSDLTDILRVRQQSLDYEYRQMEAVADFNTSIAWLKRLEIR